MLTTPVGSKCRYVVFKQFNKICFLRETTFSEFDVDLILLLFIESYFILQCTFFFWKNREKHGGPWTSLWADPWASLGFVYTLTFEWHLLQLR